VSSEDGEYPLAHVNAQLECEIELRTTPLEQSLDVTPTSK
jgi:hypothetical protein